MKRICMLGEGAWGTAVSTLLAHNGHAVRLWCHDPSVVQSIVHTRINERYMPNIVLDERIRPTADLAEALQDAEWIFEAIPVQFLRNVVQEARPYVTIDQPWVILSKGIEQHTLLLPTQIIDDVIAQDVQKTVFAGPSFAHELVQHTVTAVNVAAIDCAVGKALYDLLANDYFVPYITTDLIGTQIGAATKNIVALGIGLLEGADYGDNAKAFFITRGLNEMAFLSDLLGGKKETIYGLAGVGDLLLTSLGKGSRNLHMGQLLSTGTKLETILQQTGYVPEGINTVKAVYQIIHKHNLDLPLFQGVYEAIFHSSSIHDIMHHLMKTPFVLECDI